MSKKVEKKVAEPVKKGAVKADKKNEIKKVANSGKIVEVNVSIAELKSLAEFALHTRFLLMTLVPSPKKGSRGEKILKDVDAAGPFVRDIAIRLGLKFDEPKNASANNAKKTCKCNDCKCGKKAEAKKTSKKSAKK